MCDDEADKVELQPNAVADMVGYVLALPSQHCYSTLARFDWANHSHRWSTTST